MSTEINLLQSKRTAASSFLLSKIFIIRSVSLVLLFVISFSSIVLFVFIALSPLPGLQEREKDEIKTLSQFHPKMARLALTKNRLKNINSVLQKRIVYNDALQSVEDLLSDDAIIDSFLLDNKKITIVVSSTSLVPLDTAMVNLLKVNTKQKLFNKVTLISLSFNPETGRYELTMELLKV